MVEWSGKLLGPCRAHSIMSCKSDETQEYLKISVKYE